MNARWHRTVRILDGNPPEVANPEGIRLCLWNRDIVQVIIIVIQVLEETIII